MHADARSSQKAGLQRSGLLQAASPTAAALTKRIVGMRDLESAPLKRAVFHERESAVAAPWLLPALALASLAALAPRSACPAVPPRPLGQADPAASAGSTSREGGLKGFVKDILGFRDLVGEMQAETLTYWSFPPFTDVRCHLRITPGGDWRFENARADFSGGQVTAHAAIDFKRDKRGRKKIRELRLRARFAGVRFEELARFMKYPATRGTVSSRVELRVTSEGRAGLSGEAEFRLRGGDLRRLPMIVRIYSFLSFPGMDKAGMKVENVDARMTLTPRAIVFQDLTMSTSDGAFALRAERLGSVTYGGRLDFLFRPVIESRILKNVPIIGATLGKIIGDIEQRGMRVRVTGTAAEPRFNWAAFR